MTNDDLDSRVLECATVVRTLVHDLSTADGPPTIEQAVALGVLLGAVTALDALCKPAIDGAITELLAQGLIERAEDNSHE